MRDAVLYELANRWDRDAEPPECQDGSPEGERKNDVAKGIREGKRECADGLRSLIQLLGDPQTTTVSMMDVRGKTKY